MHTLHSGDRSCASTFQDTPGFGRLPAFRLSMAPKRAPNREPGEGSLSLPLRWVSEPVLPGLADAVAVVGRRFELQLPSWATAGARRSLKRGTQAGDRGCCFLGDRGIGSPGLFLELFLVLSSPPHGAVACCLLHLKAAATDAHAKRCANQQFWTT